MLYIYIYIYICNVKSNSHRISELRSIAKEGSINGHQNLSKKIGNLFTKRQRPKNL